MGQPARRILHRYFRDFAASALFWDRHVGFGHPHRQPGWLRYPYQRGRWRLPRQNRASRRYSQALRYLCRIFAADADRRRDPATSARPSGDRTLESDSQPRRGAPQRAADHVVRFRWLRHRAISRRCAMSRNSLAAPDCTKSWISSPIQTSHAICSACCCGLRPLCQPRSPQQSTAEQLLDREHRRTMIDLRYGHGWHSCYLQPSRDDCSRPDLSAAIWAASKPPESSSSPLQRKVRPGAPSREDHDCRGRFVGKGR